MFTRVIKCQAKPDQGEAVRKMVKDELLPVLQEQPGFVDLAVLSDRTNSQRVVFMSFWATREDAEEYHRLHYYMVSNMLKLILESPPTLETFAVIASTAHRIVVDIAA